MNWDTSLVEASGGNGKSKARDRTGAQAAGNDAVRRWASIFIVNFEGRDTRTDLYPDRRRYVWNNDHETAFLRNDCGRFIDDECWGRDRNRDHRQSDAPR